MASNFLDSVTVAVTSFKRAAHLRRALESVRAAGLRRVAIAAVCATPEVREIIRAESKAWLSFDVAFIDEDPGCNATWIAAAYLSRTARVIILHDDDALSPALGLALNDIVAPALEAGAGFATWQADLIFDDGKKQPCPFWDRPTGVYPSADLAWIFNARGRLSLSPVVSLLDRRTVIEAGKWADQALMGHNECLERPGMLLGTEIVVYALHCRRFPKFLNVALPLSCYGSHPGSGTIQWQNLGIGRLLEGYNFARDACRAQRPPPAPRLLVTWYDIAPRGEDEARRFRAIDHSWAHLFGTGIAVPLPIRPGELPLNEEGCVPKSVDIFDWIAARALPEDVCFYVNRDIGLTTETPSRVFAAAAAGCGACACPRRSLKQEPGRLYRSVRNCPHDGGFDAFAFTPAWWENNRRRMPDMFIGREAWDTVLRALIMETADRKMMRDPGRLNRYLEERTTCDDVCYHEPHVSAWQLGRLSLPSQLHNRILARSFFEARGIKLAGLSPPPARALAGRAP